MGAAPAPDWLHTHGLHAQQMGRACRTAAEAAQAARRYAGLLEGEPAQQLWPGTLQQQLHLGDDAFVGRMQALAGPSGSRPRKCRAPSVGQRW